MTAVQITPAPSPAPQRSDRSTFADRADARLTWEDAHLVPELNAAVAQVNDNTVICEAGAQAAQVAIASAHFKGAWSTLAGALAVPASVFHSGAFWVLLSDVADVTAKVPGVAAEWEEAQTVSQLPWFTASGSIAKGGAAAINSDGTVSAPAITAAAAGGSTAISPTSYYGAICYAADQDKFVLAASDGANVKARVGTLSGTTVTWGALSATIGASYAKQGIAYVGNGKVVVVYAPASGVFAAVGTISGSTITFGTPVQITATASSYVDRYGITFDPDTGSVVVVYQNGSGNSFAIAGAVSGTTITFGTAVDVGAISPSAHVVSMPGTGGQVFLAYAAGGTVSYMARILSLVGTSITANAAYTWGVRGTPGVPMRAAFDPVSRKVLVVACATSGNVGVAAVASVALTEIAFGTSRTFSAGGITPSVMHAHWDTSAGVPVVLYGDAGNSNYGTMVSGSIASGVFVAESKTVFYSGTVQYITAVQGAGKNVAIYGDASSYSVVTPYSTTARGFIGFAQTAVSNAESVQIAATQFVDENQSGLTVGRRCYLADNGALTLTQTDTFAGTSVGTTRILVKG